MDSIPKTLGVVRLRQVSKPSEHRKTDLIGQNERRDHPGKFKGDGYMIFHFLF